MHFLTPTNEPRDGRVLKRERKIKNVMALSRLLQRKTGLYGQQENLTLHELGVSELAPAHAHRQDACARRIGKYMSTLLP